MIKRNTTIVTILVLIVVVVIVAKVSAQEARLGVNELRDRADVSDVCDQRVRVEVKDECGVADVECRRDCVVRNQVPEPVVLVGNRVGRYEGVQVGRQVEDVPDKLAEDVKVGESVERVDAGDASPTERVLVYEVAARQVVYGSVPEPVTVSRQRAGVECTRGLGCSLDATVNVVGRVGVRLV
jgi:hypothetical protein